MASDRHTQNATKILRVVEAMPSEGNIRILSEALANAEREGMRRAAEIAKEYVWDEHALAQATDIGRACHHQSREIATAILSEAGDDA